MDHIQKLYDACNYLLSELSDETINLPKGNTFQSLLSSGKIVDGWYVLNSKTGEVVSGPAVRSYIAYDSANKSDIDPKDLDVVKVKDSKYISPKDFSKQPFGENLPAGWYVIDKSSKIIVKGPVNNSQAKLYSSGDNIPVEANGKVK